GGVGANDDGAATPGTMSTSHRTAETPADVAWPSLLGARDNSSNNNHPDNNLAVRQREGNESSLVHLRGSPRRRRGGRDDANRLSGRTQLGAKMASSSPPSTAAAAAAAGWGRQGPRKPTTPTSSSPAAVAAGVAAGVAAACSTGGAKRKRPASATGGGPGQRFGATAWPKLRGG
ncbi:unnamed protein product, partial [Ectocarpus sp. 12 AP-2014]